MHRPLCRSVTLAVIAGRDHFDVAELLSDPSSPSAQALLTLLAQAPLAPASIDV